MRLHHLVCLWGLSRISSALLEEKFVSFEDSPGSVPLHQADILFADDDPIGVRIAAESVGSDFAQITGNKPEIIGVKIDSLVNPQISARNAIIAGTVNSTLLRTLVSDRKITVSDIEGKWESFKTTVVESPLPEIDRALVIAGSDKRAVIFGLYTLADQSGQSPLVKLSSVVRERSLMPL